MPASSFWNFISFILLNSIVISKVLSGSIILLSSQIVSKPHHSHCSSSTMYTSASPAWRGDCVISMACLCVTLLGAAFRSNRLCLKLVHHDFHIYLKPKKINHHFGELIIVSALQICSLVCAKCNSSTLFGCSQHLWLVCGKALKLVPSSWNQPDHSEALLHKYQSMLTSNKVSQFHCHTFLTWFPLNLDIY